MVKIGYQDLRKKETLGSNRLSFLAIKIKKETIVQLTDSKMGKTRKIKLFLGLNSKICSHVREIYL